MTAIEIKISECRGIYIATANAYVYCIIKYGKREFGKTVSLPYSQGTGIDETTLIWNQSFMKDLGKSIDPTDEIVIEIRKTSISSKDKMDEVVGRSTLSLMQVVTKSKRDTWVGLERVKVDIPVTIGKEHVEKESKRKKVRKFLPSKLRRKKHENNDSGSDSSIAQIESTEKPGRLKLSYYVVKEIAPEVTMLSATIAANTPIPIDERSIISSISSVQSIESGDQLVHGSDKDTSSDPSVSHEIGPFAERNKSLKRTISGTSHISDTSTERIARINSRNSVRSVDNVSVKSSPGARTSADLSSKRSVRSLGNKIEHTQSNPFARTNSASKITQKGQKLLKAAKGKIGHGYANSITDDVYDEDANTDDEGATIVSEVPEKEIVAKVVSVKPLYPEAGELFILQSFADHVEHYGQNLSEKNKNKAFVALLANQMRWRSGNETRSIDLANIVNIEASPSQNRLRISLHCDAQLMNAQPRASKLLGGLACDATETHEFKFEANDTAQIWNTCIKEKVDEAKNVPQLQDAVKAANPKTFLKFANNLQADKESRRGRLLGANLVVLGIVEYRDAVVALYGGEQDTESSISLKERIDIVGLVLETFPSSVLEPFEINKRPTHGQTLLHLAIKLCTGPEMIWADAFHIQLYDKLLGFEQSLAVIPDDRLNTPAHFASQLLNMSALEYLFSQDSFPKQELGSMTNDDNMTVLSCLLNSIATKSRKDESREFIPDAIELARSIIVEMPNFGKVYKPKRSLFNFSRETNQLKAGFVNDEELDLDASVVDAVKLEQGLHTSEFRVICKYFSLDFVCKAMECIPIQKVENYCRGCTPVVCERMQQNSQSIDSVSIAAIVIANSIPSNEYVDDFFENQAHFWKGFLMTLEDIELLQKKVAQCLPSEMAANPANQSSWLNRLVRRKSTDEVVHFEEKDIYDQDLFLKPLIRKNKSSFLNDCKWLSVDYRWERGEVSK